jgi:hypothetical protein
LFLRRSIAAFEGEQKADTYLKPLAAQYSVEYARDELGLARISKRKKHWSGAATPADVEGDVAQGVVAADPEKNRDIVAEIQRGWLLLRPGYFYAT